MIIIKKKFKKQKIKLLIKKKNDKIINKEKKLIEKDIFIIKYIGTINLLTNNPNNLQKVNFIIQLKNILNDQTLLRVFIRILLEANKNYF